MNEVRYSLQVLPLNDNQCEINMRKLLLLVLLLQGQLYAVDFFVSPQGSDNNSGSLDKPFKTLQKAQQAVRASGKLKQEVANIFLRGGNHYLPATLLLTDKDSGSTEFPLTISGYKTEKAVVSGGLKLKLEWKAEGNGLYSAKVEQDIKIDQLFCNGKRQYMARYPNYDAKAFPYNGAAADAFSPARAAKWKNPAGGFIHAMHSAGWGGYHYKITGKDKNNKVQYKGGWQNNRQMGMHKNQRFVENIFEELDVAGEWYHNAAEKKIYFMPPEGVDVNTSVFEAARLATLIELKGSKQTPVKHLELKGLTFRHAIRTFMLSKEPLLRSDWTIYRGASVLLEGAEDCKIKNCEFDQVGGNAVFVNKYNRRISIEGTHIHGVGASAICFVGDPKSVRNPLFEYHQTQHYKDIDKTPGAIGDDFPKNCVVNDCLIHDIGIVEKQATGVQVSMSSKITISHCSIYDVGRAGINFSEGTFGGHLIEFCDVFDTVRETHDHGSFNSWGRDRFWHLKGAPAAELAKLAMLDCEKNVIRNSRWRCDHGWDVDLDDGSSNYDIYNNLFLNRGLKLREGFRRHVWNNIAVNNTLHPHVWYANSGDVVEKNIWMRPYASIRAKMNPQVNDNFFTSEVAMKKFQHQGADKDSLFGDPMFVDPAKGDYRVKPGSPVLKTGFVNFPMDQFGVKRPELKKLARTPVLPELQLTGGAAISSVNESRKNAVESSFYWNGAKLEAISGEAFSAFGVSKEDGGLQLVSVPPKSLAAQTGLKRGDLLMTLNGVKLIKVSDLMNASHNGKAELTYVRAQKLERLSMKNFIRISFESGKKLELEQDVLPIKSIKTFPASSNEKPASLTDGKLAENYGPVFANGVRGGLYVISLNEAKEINGFSSFSYNLGGRRGVQRYTVYGSNKDKAPDSLKGLTPLCSVDSSHLQQVKFQRSRIEGDLGRFKHLVLQVHPANGNENTAFQEMQLK